MKVLLWEISYIGFRSREWKKLAKEGRRIAAIKALRNSDPKHYSLKVAKEKVDAYMAKVGVK